MDSSCPACDTLSSPMLAIVTFPTIEETEQNWTKATEEEKQFVHARKRWLANWAVASLQSGDQLPEWVGPAAALAWDSVESDYGEPSFTVIKHGDREIWREPICWEGYDRFREVVRILKQRYGKRLLDVVPTSASELYLFGDSITAHEYVEQVRRSLK